MSKRFTKVALLQGGNSPEREVSLISASNVANALQEICEELILFDPKKQPLSELLELKVERVFNILHGGAGEDGRVQAALELLKIPQTGSNHQACVLAMNKNLSKLLFLNNEIPTPLWYIANDSDIDTLNEIQINLGNKLFVKPNNGGSSLCSRFVDSVEDLKTAIEDALTIDKDVLIEQFIDGIEVTYSILKDEVLPGIKIEVNDGFYDYDAKYVSEETKFICPPQIPTNLDEKAQELSLLAFKLLGCNSWGRVDLMISGHDIFVLEVNTVPGMTSHSLVPQAAKAKGIEFVAVVEKILEDAK